MIKLIHDFNGEEDFDGTDRIETLCHLENAEWIAVKIVRDFGYNRKDPYIPNPMTSYQITDDLYEFTNNLIDYVDCKNGVQIYQDTDTGEYYLQITGQLFFDKNTDKPIGEDTVKVYYKEFVW
jgi:hypothetical protein